MSESKSSDTVVVTETGKINLIRDYFHKPCEFNYLKIQSNTFNSIVFAKKILFR